MAQATFHFPRGFLWGTATSSHQVEGNNTNNNWYAWEQQEGRILQGHKSGLACDWWGGRWQEDLNRAYESGQNAHRLSIEWSRVQPTPDVWDEDALDRYRQILRHLNERGMTAMVTLHHFTDPLWLVEKGGWENEAVVDYFEAYTRKVVEALKDYVNLWITINEPNILFVLAYIQGLFPPGKQSLASAAKYALHATRAHAAAYRAIHHLQPQARVGIALNYRSIKPALSWSPFDHWAARTSSRLFNDLFPQAIAQGVLHLLSTSQKVPEAKGTQDFVGINYYTRSRAHFDLRAFRQAFLRESFPPDADLSDTGFLANEPEGLFEAIQWGRQFDLPMIITENGVEDADDHLRPRYLVQHIHQMWRAVNFNIPVKGYFHWTLVDNFEWERGWTQRFGLWELNPETQARRKRPSADLYAEICHQNALSYEMVATYAPEVLSRIFPD